jgi:hypothetical protein
MFFALSLKGLGHEIGIRFKRFGPLGLGKEKVWQIFIISAFNFILI